MKNFQEVIVSYDIADNKTRLKIYEGLKDMGLSPIQKSVFWGYVNQAEKQIILTMIEKTKDSDSMFLINSNLKKNQSANSKGLDLTSGDIDPMGYTVL